MLDVNILALSIVTREAVALMRANNVDDGHVININSLFGHFVIGLFMYTASKFAVTALTEGNFMISFRVACCNFYVVMQLYLQCLHSFLKTLILISFAINCKYNRDEKMLR